MTSTEEQVKSAILKHKGIARKQQIARELNLSLDYADLICRGLERKGTIVSSDGKYTLVTSRRKITRDARSNKIAESTKKFSLSDIPGMAEDLLYTLKNAGYATIESLAEAPIAKFMQEAKLELHEAARLINQARKILGRVKDNEIVEGEKEQIS